MTDIKKLDIVKTDSNLKIEWKVESSEIIDTGTNSYIKLGRVYTRYQMLKDMVAMWLWISENPEKTKFDYKRAHRDRTQTTCPTCLYDDIHEEDGESSLCACPFPYNGVDGHSDCEAEDSYFWKYCNSTTDRGKKIYAKEIYKISLRELAREQKLIDSLDFTS